MKHTINTLFIALILTLISSPHITAMKHKKIKTNKNRSQLFLKSTPMTQEKAKRRSKFAKYITNKINLYHQEITNDFIEQCNLKNIDITKPLYLSEKKMSSLSQDPFEIEENIRNIESLNKRFFYLTRCLTIPKLNTKIKLEISDKYENLLISILGDLGHPAFLLPSFIHFNINSILIKLDSIQLFLILALQQSASNNKYVKIHSDWLKVFDALPKYFQDKYENLIDYHENRFDLRKKYFFLF